MVSALTMNHQDPLILVKTPFTNVFVTLAAFLLSYFHVSR